MRNRRPPWYWENREYESNIHKFRVAMRFTVNELANAIGTSQGTLTALANGMEAPFYIRNGKQGHVKPYVQKMAEVLHVPLDELFPRYICDIERHRANSKTLMPSQLPGLMISEATARMLNSPHEIMENKEKASAVSSALRSLSPNERHVLRRRFVFGETLGHIGDRFGVTKTTIKNIELRALRKMRERLSSCGLEEGAAA